MTISDGQPSRFFIFYFYYYYYYYYYFFKDTLLDFELPNS